MNERSLLKTARATGSSWMFSFLGTVGVCYVVAMGGILYWGLGNRERLEQDRERLQTCQQTLLASEKYDGQTIELFCSNSCLRDSLSELRANQIEGNIETLVRETYQRCGEQNWPKR